MSEIKKALLEKQLAEWPRHLQGAKMGNPFAGLCMRCYGRHAPPRDEICPNAAVEQEARDA